MRIRTHPRRWVIETESPMLTVVLDVTLDGRYQGGYNAGEWRVYNEPDTESLVPQTAPMGTGEAVLKPALAPRVSVL